MGMSIANNSRNRVNGDSINVGAKGNRIGANDGIGDGDVNSVRELVVNIFGNGVANIVFVRIGGIKTRECIQYGGGVEVFCIRGNIYRFVFYLDAL